MTDAELSKKLGHYQRTESISISLGVILVITACISMFIQRDPMLVCALAFPGVALFLLVAKPAQTKKKALMQQQLGGFFRTELTKAFGPEPRPATLPIDWAYLEAAKLSAVSFTECTGTDFHEGEHKGLRFSAANVELRRTVEEKSGPDNDNWMTRTETLARVSSVRKYPPSCSRSSAFFFFWAGFATSRNSATPGKTIAQISRGSRRMNIVMHPAATSRTPSSIPMLSVA